jgi:hypothetical protein
MWAKILAGAVLLVILIGSVTYSMGFVAGARSMARGTHGPKA